MLGATSTVEGTERRLIYTSLAPNGDTNVLTTSAIKIRFDRLLSPTSASRQAICLQPLLRKVESPADCVAGLFLEPAYDPTRREVTYRHPLGQTLAADIVYELTVYTALDANDGGFRSFEGTPLGAVARWAFGVAHDGPTPPPRDLLPDGDHYCTSADPGCFPRCKASCEASCADDGCVSTCLDGCARTCPRSVNGILGGNGCSLDGCHGGAAHAAGLDMRSGKALAETAFGHVAHGAQTGAGAHLPEANPSRFGRAMPLIDLGAPGNSYLVYKLLASPDTPLEVPLPEVERRRVHATIVTGTPMPPSQAYAAHLRPGEPEWLAEWIFQQAPVAATCP